MENDILQFACQVDGVRTLKDKGLKITLETQEIPPDEKTLLFGFGEKNIWCAFKEMPLDIEDIDIQEPSPEFKDDKSPSKRLRSVLYIYWSQNYSSKRPFQEWYQEIMDKIIQKYKEKLE